MSDKYVERQKFNGERFKADAHSFTIIHVQLHLWNTIKLAVNVHNHLAHITCTQCIDAGYFYTSHIAQ